MDKCCAVLRMVTLIGVRIVGLLSLSSPPAWTSVVRAASVKLSKVDMLLVLHVRSNMSGEGSLYIWQLCPFLTVGECIEDKLYVLSVNAVACSAHVVLLHTCHSWSGHVLNTCCVGYEVVLWSPLASDHRHFKFLSSFSRSISFPSPTQQVSLQTPGEASKS